MFHHSWRQQIKNHTQINYTVYKRLFQSKSFINIAPSPLLDVQTFRRKKDDYTAGTSSNMARKKLHFENNNQSSLVKMNKLMNRA